MKRSLLGAALALAGLACGQEFSLGSKVGGFSLQDVKGNAVGYAALKGDVTVLVFVATQCPISNDYNERMNALFKEYSGRGVKFIFVNANSTEPAAEVDAHAKKNFAFAVYKDAGNAVADRFGAQVTPEAFVMDKDGVIRYHGYIDDSRNAQRITRRGLRDALDAVLEGRPVAAAQTKAFGCTIKRAKKS
ncbi:MAG: redoxin domain-containing protein [Bryobacteraceae bacterium]